MRPNRSTEATRRWRSNEEARRKERLANRARTRAWVELARRHRSEFEQIVKLKRDELEAEDA